jgi:hypothetical protein
MSKIVYVSYVVDDVFRIPKGLDLEDKTQVKDWGVKYNTLVIYKVDGTRLEITSENWIHDNDLKHPKETTIQDAMDFGIESEDETDK